MPITHMISAISAFTSAKPWEKSGKGGALILGIKNTEGKIGYAVVCGRDNGYSLAFCPNEQALASYAALLEAKKKDENELEQIGLLLDQDCIECQLIWDGEENDALEKWLYVFGVETEGWPEDLPRVLRYKPGFLSQFCSEEEQETMNAALLAAVDFVKNPEAQKVYDAIRQEVGGILCVEMKEDGGCSWKAINLAGSMNLQFPAPALEDELAARRLRRLPVSGSEVRCAVRRLPMPVDEGALRVSTVMILIDDQIGVVAAPMVGDYDKEYGNFAGEYISYVEEFGRPKRILATDPRTYSLLSELAAQMSTPIQRVGSMPEINEAIDGLMEFLKAKIVEEFGDGEEEEVEVEPTTKVPGIGGALYSGFNGTMEAVGEHLLKKMNHPDDDLEENLLIRVTYPEDPAFWLYAAVKTDSALRPLDKYIRDIWVECCGHSSIFHAGDVDYTSNTRILPGKSMNAKLIDVIKPGVPLEYEYDIGTPTELRVELVGKVRLAPRREKVLHLAQNFMPEYKCIRCGRRADLVDRSEMGPIAENVICARCSRKETETGRYLPLLNSPRTGICGYGMWFGDEDDE